MPFVPPGRQESRETPWRGRLGPLPRESRLFDEERPDVARAIGVCGIALDTFLDELALLVGRGRNVSAEFEFIRGGEPVRRKHRADVAAFDEFGERVAGGLRDFEREAGPLF